MQFKVLACLYFALGVLFTSNLMADTTATSDDLQIDYLLHAEFSEISPELNQVDFDSDANFCLSTLNNYCTGCDCLCPEVTLTCHVLLRSSAQPRAPPY